MVHEWYMAAYLKMSMRAFSGRSRKLKAFFSVCSVVCFHFSLRCFLRAWPFVWDMIDTYMNSLVGLWHSHFCVDNPVHDICADSGGMISGRTISSVVERQRNGGRDEK